jgi:thermitase
VSRTQRRFVLRFSGDPPPGIGRLLADHPQVEYVEPNRVRRTTIAAPTDGYYGSQWALTMVKALEAWKSLPARYLTSSTAGSGRVKVAVLDTGTDCTHPDFKNSGGTSTNSALGGQLNWALSGQVYATTVPSPACSWQDDHGHGTHVAGTVAAATNNAAGVAALGYPVEVVTFKVLDSSGSGSDILISDAIVDAADAGAQVISMSLGASGYSQVLQDAINYAWERNALVVVAAGNANTTSMYFPAWANHAMAVAAVDSSGARASYSNRGNSIDIAAPGSSILSTYPTYLAASGRPLPAWPPTPSPSAFSDRPSRPSRRAAGT